MMEDRGGSGSPGKEGRGRTKTDDLYSSRDQFFSFETGGFLDDLSDDEDPVLGSRGPRETQRLSSALDSQRRNTNPFDIERMVGLNNSIKKYKYKKWQGAKLQPINIKQVKLI